MREVSGSEAEERRVLFWSAGRQAREDTILEIARKCLEAALKALHEDLGRKGCFKSRLGFRLVQHRKKEHIRAHLFIAVPACHAVRQLWRKLEPGSG